MFWKPKLNCWYVRTRLAARFSDDPKSNRLRFNYELIVYPTFKDFKSAMDKKKVYNCRAVCFSASENGMAYICVPLNVRYNTIAHEAVHLSLDMFRRRKFRISRLGRMEELFARLVDGLTQTMVKDVRNCRRQAKQRKKRE